MADSKKHRPKKHRSEEERSGLKRPTRFELSQEYRSSLRNLDATARGRLADRGQAFWRDWLKLDITDEDLYRRWDYKPLHGAPKGLRVMQVRALKDYRVALLVVTQGKQCVWFLRAYLRKSGNKNRTDYERAFEVAKRINEEER